MKQLEELGLLISKKNVPTMSYRGRVNQDYWAANFQAIKDLEQSTKLNWTKTQLEFRKADTHVFSVDQATEFGLIEAILLNHFDFFAKQNHLSETFIFPDENGLLRPYVPFGRVSLTKYFPYLQENRIRGAINELQGLQLISLSKSPNKGRTSTENWATYGPNHEGYCDSYCGRKIYLGGIENTVGGIENTVGGIENTVGGIENSLIKLHTKTTYKNLINFNNKNKLNSSKSKSKSNSYSCEQGVLV
jgi:hypothetical protein